MEASTSFYKLYNGFKKKGIDAKVANVIHLRRIIGKNDILDAHRLADMLRLNTLPEAFIPGEKIQHMRNFVNLYHRFVKENTRLKNQIHALLDMNGVNIPTRTPFCKAWCFKLQKYIAESECIELRYLFDAQQDVQRRVSLANAELIGYTKRHFGKEVELLQSIPGIGETIAPYIIAQVMPVTRFADKKKLRRYAGVIPVSNMSDNKTYATYLPKGTSRTLLRYAFVEAANNAVRVKGRLKDYFKKKSKGRGRKQALMHVASSMSDIVYNVLTRGEPYVM
jgi:transposase